jgi:hypothetical protein
LTPFQGLEIVQLSAKRINSDQVQLVHCSHTGNPSIVSRWILFIVPILAILWIPGIIVLTGSFPHAQASLTTVLIAAAERHAGVGHRSFMVVNLVVRLLGRRVICLGALVFLSDTMPQAGGPLWPCRELLSSLQLSDIHVLR